MSEENWFDIRQNIDNCIKAGQIDRARRDLNAINIVKVPKSEKIHLANLCRRTGLLNLGLKFLAKIIRDDVEGIIPAHPNEKAEYGVLLQRIGAVDEAKKILKNIDSDETPVAELYLAFCHFNQWNYAAAIEPLKKYLSLIDPDSYAFTVGQVNLAAAYVNVRDFANADKLLAELIETTTRKKMNLLRSNCLEILSQLEIQKENFENALKLLDQSESELSSHQVLQKFFIYKWKSISKASMDPQKVDWEAMRAEAFRINHPESQREIDYYEAVINQNYNLGLKVLFGTPYPEYRKNLIEKMNLEAPDYYRWSEDDPSQNKIEFDLLMAHSFDKSIELKLGSSLHRLLCILVKDLYRPKRLGALFSYLYPDEYFDPHSSPDRVHQLLRRFRKEFDSNRAMELITHSQGYMVTKSEKLAIWLPKEYPDITRESLVVSQIDRVFKGEKFSRTDFQKEFNYEYTASNRWINELIELGFLDKIGSGRGTYYKLKVS